MKIENKKAYFDFEIITKYEAGMILEGHEVKSIRDGKMTIKGSFCKFVKNELFLFDSNITQFKEANTFNPIDEKRVRKLLLHKKELIKLEKEVDLKGLSILPLKVYFNDNNKCKIMIGLGKGKKLYQKKDVIKERDLARQQKKEDFN